MKTSLKIGGLVAAMMLAVSGASFAADQVSPYVHSADGKIVKSGFGLCWRTNFWTPALAEASGEGCQCDADVLPAEACQPKQARRSGCSRCRKGDLLRRHALQLRQVHPQG